MLEPRGTKAHAEIFECQKMSTRPSVTGLYVYVCKQQDKLAWKNGRMVWVPSILEGVAGCRALWSVSATGKSRECA